MNRQIYEEASEWLVELRVGDVDRAARERLDAWFRASPENMRAFIELSNIWEEGDDPDLDRNHSTDELIARARGMSNVVVFEPMRTDPGSTPQPFSGSLKQRLFSSARSAPEEPAVATKLQTIAAEDLKTISAVKWGTSRPRPWGARMAASLAAVVVGASVAIWVYVAQFPTYATSIGEQRIVRLSDGTEVQLNARSRIRVHYSEHERHVDLLAGQALFKVAKNPARPFIVASDGARVRAVGTQFDVYRKAEGTTVTVVEGRVSVTPEDVAQISPVSLAQSGTAQPELATGLPASAPVLVSAGEQVVATPSKVSKPARTDVAAATAWTQRELVFDSTPLAEVAREFNRYNAKPLMVTDDRLKAFHVTGVFSSTDPASLLRFLRAQPEIEVAESESGIRIAHR